MNALHKAEKSKLSKLVSDVQVAVETLSVLGRLWKGQTREGLELVIANIVNFKETYRSYSRQYTTNTIAMSLLSHYDSNSQHLVNDWQNLVKVKSINDPLEILERFKKETLGTIVGMRGIRDDPEIKVSDLVAVKIAGCLEHSTAKSDFWTTSRKSESKEKPSINAHQATEMGGAKDNKNIGSREQSKEHKKPAMADHAIFKLRRYLEANPHLCPNCIMSHKLKDCPDLDKKDPGKNMAAYFWPEYEKETSMKRWKSQRNYVAWMNHNIPRK